MNGLREVAEWTCGFEVRGVPAVFQVSFMPEGADPVVDFRSSLQADFEKGKAFWQALHERGVRTTARNFWFLSTAHTDEDIERTLRSTAEALGWHWPKPNEFWNEGETTP
ncbi:MAG: hypothetical protein GX616_25920 [Planctomycetes bacterium]|nr:hypothetical protein [Planctomycetota bacterium]